MATIKLKLSHKNIPKNFLMILCLITFTVYIKAQSIAPQVITSGASNFSQSNGSISFTIGELVVTTETNGSGNYLGNGFIPGSVISTTVMSIEQPDASIFRVKVYPNPTNDLLFVDFITSQVDWVRIEIVDPQGRLLFSEKYASMANHIGINMAKWLTGNYFLLLKDLQNRSIGKYQIIKH